MNALYKDYGAKGLAMVAIATDIGGKAVVTPFIQTYGLTFPVLLDPQDIVGRQLQVSGIPTSYLLDKRGRVIGLVIGERDWNSRQMRHLVGASNHCLLPINKQLCNNLINYLPESNTERQIRRCC